MRQVTTILAAAAFASNLLASVTVARGEGYCGAIRCDQTGGGQATHHGSGLHHHAMRRYNKFRVPYFQALLAQARKQTRAEDGSREIVRRPGNPMLRYVGSSDRLADTSAAVASTSLQESLKL